jgi:hypothetical protein
MGGACRTNGEKRNAYRLFVGKPQGPEGRQRCSWVDNDKMDLGGTGWHGMEWTGLAENRDKWRDPVNAVINLRCKI